MSRKIFTFAHVSNEIIDAWLVLPPCSPSLEYRYCHPDCPYFNSCYPPSDDDFD